MNFYSGGFLKNVLQLVEIDYIISNRFSKHTTSFLLQQLSFGTFACFSIFGETFQSNFKGV